MLESRDLGVNSGVDAGPVELELFEWSFTSGVVFEALKWLRSSSRSCPRYLLPDTLLLADVTGGGRIPAFVVLPRRVRSMCGRKPSLFGVASAAASGDLGVAASGIS